jgi:NAD(P)-dependent dehydrogenase (short-subunit alcohol dehydrogenase family)
MFFSERFLDGQVAIITGGGTGIGLEIAKLFGELGAKLVLAGRRREVLDAAVRELEQAGREALGVVTNVREADSVQAMVERAVERFGQVDVLVNNAGANFICPSVSISPNGWRSVLSTILDGTFYCCRFAGAKMLERGTGKIVSIVTPYAQTGAPGFLPSCAGKAGVVAITKTLAVEWAQFGVRVNAVSPGAVDSEGAGARLWPTPEDKEKVLADIPVHRMATAHEVAQVVAFLVSPAAGFMNGSIVDMDGAQSLGRGILKQIEA